MLGADGADGALEAVIGGAAGGGGGTTTTGGAGGGVAGRMGGADAAGAAGRTGGADAAGATGGAGGCGGGAGFSGGGGTMVGRGAGVGDATAAGGTGGAAGFGAGGTIVGLGATGGGAGLGGGGAAAASFFCVIAFSTSPGREMCDKSILVLISSSPRSERVVRAEGDCASAEPRMWTRTFSASNSSSELECVFFSVTPTSGSASRIALLFTSSSLARSLIRTLLIRPFCFPALC